MRIVSLLIAFCFSLNVMASTGTIQELERSIDEYNYSLMVEWDQKDMAFYEAQTKIFFSQLEKMIKEEGLTQKEIMTLLQTKVKDKSILNALKLKLSILSKNSTPEDLMSVLKDTSKEFYAKGASWSGEVIIGTSILVVFIGLIAYSVWWDNTHQCVAYDSEYVCNNYNTCSGYGYGYGYGAGYGSCYAPSTTYCGYQDVCTKYEKK